MSATAALDRLAMRARPEGTPIMHQRWENLLFLHWPIPPAVLRAAIPSELELDTFEDEAWIGITPFALTNVHLTSMPPIPGLNAFEEINVRTYVHYRGIPGIWFFSLDASKAIPAVTARIFFLLPYFKAQVKFEQNAPDFRFESARIGLPAAHFRATWRTGVRLRDPDLESLAFFLVERYCYFAVQEGAVYVTRVYHHPWILDEATIQLHSSTMIGATGIPEPGTTPLAYFSRELEVDIWKPASASSLALS